MKFFRKKHTGLNDESYNVVQSISKAKVLYKKLVMLSHPDKHPQKEALATELTNLVNANKYNYRELLLLEEQIKKLHHGI